MARNPFKESQMLNYLEDSFQLIIRQALIEGSTPNTPVIEFRHPKELQEIIKLHIGENGESTEALHELTSLVIKYSVKTANPRFYNQLYSGIEPAGLMGAILTEVLNTNLHTFEVAPVFVIVEKYILEKMCNLIGFENGDGVFGPGGSFIIILALHVARYKRYPEMKTKGLFGLPRLRVYTSGEAHYSLMKGASFLGLGTDSVVKIDTDVRGKMIPKDLETKIILDKEAGCLPLFVMATSGTTVLGAYDPLLEIADVCEHHDLWLHVDGCWGGGVILSSKFKHLVAGIQRADSVSWNMHKMAGVPLQCSALLVKEKGLLDKCNSTAVDYLFQTDKYYDTDFDIGNKTVQCGRKADSLKLWMQWKAVGDAGMRCRVEKAFDNAEYLTELLRHTEGFRLVLPEFECVNICFWYIPPCLQGQEKTNEWWARLGKVAPIIKRDMVEQGTMMVGYQPLVVKNLVNFFRIIIVNPMNDHSAMDFVVSEIGRLGRRIGFEELTF